MAPSEDLPKSEVNQAGSHSRNRPRRRARSRRCLLKGCVRIYRPDHPLQRYCSDACRQKAKKWRRWKAQQQYRATESGKAKRRAQCRRHRRRRKARKRVSEAAVRGARVIPIRFFRSWLRSTRLLRDVREEPALSVAAVLLPPVPAGFGAGSGEGAALERARQRALVGMRLEPACEAEPMSERCCSPSRDRPDILPSRGAIVTVALPTRRGRGSEASRHGAFRSLFFFMLGDLHGQQQRGDEGTGAETCRGSRERCSSCPGSGRVSDG